MLPRAGFLLLGLVLLPHLGHTQGVEDGARRSGDVRSTRHNMSAVGAAAGDAREVCVYCHTPSLADAADAGGAVVNTTPPRWQPGFGRSGAPFEYDIYDDIGRGEGVGSQSVACLSCHDHAQAFGISDLDHPIGIPYRGALAYDPRKASAETPAEAVVRRGSRAKIEEADYRPARQSVINNREVWWVPTSDSSVARTRQDLPLYVRARPDIIDSGIPYLECSSCHDPHSSNRLFLRVTNQQSRLCLSCHEK